MANVYTVQSASGEILCASTNVRKAVDAALVWLNAEASGQESPDQVASYLLVDGERQDDPDTAIKAAFRGRPGSHVSVCLDPDLSSLVITFLQTI